MSKAAVRTEKGQYTSQSQVADLLKQASAIEADYRRLHKQREAIKKELKTLMPARGVEKLTTGRIVVTVASRCRQSLVKEKVAEILSEEQYLTCLKTTEYYECSIKLVPAENETEL